MNDKPEHNVFLKIFKLALGFDKSNDQILQELSHYIVDNLITKICIFIAKEKNLSYKTTTSSGRERTYDFPKLYRDILMKEYPNVPDYDKEIKRLHKLRNFFQHGSGSIELSIRKEFAEDYIKKVGKILNEIGIDIKDIEAISSIEVSQASLREEIKADEKSTSEQINNIVDELEDFFVERCKKFKRISTSSRFFKVMEKDQSIPLEMYIKIIPDIIIERSLFNDNLEEIKEYLEKNKYGPPTDSIILAEIFGELSISRELLYHCSDQEMVGSIIINKKGFILYHWSYNERKENNSLPTNYMCAYMLGLLDFIYKFYRKVGINQSFKLIIDLKGIEDWSFSPLPKYLLKNHVYRFTNKEFKPIEKNIEMKELELIENRFNIITDVFTKILRDFGYPGQYVVPPEIKNFYLNN
ncbi:MAG: hypothetical protein ACTSO4_17190 [Promethearchaeota archaeon]